MAYSLIFFIAAALLGLYLASHVLGGKFPPWAATLTHGALALAGLVVLGLNLGDGGTWALIGLVVLVLTAAGGAYLGFHHFKGKLPARAIVHAHVFAALLGLALVGMAVFTP